MLVRWKTLSGMAAPWSQVSCTSLQLYRGAFGFRQFKNTRLVYSSRYTHSKSEDIKRKEINILSEKDLFPSKLTQNQDLFGTLGGEHYEVSAGLTDDDGESEFLAKISDTGRPRPFDYLSQIETLLKPPNVDLRQALEIFEVDMKKEYVKPIPDIYRVLIHACGRKGYSDKAFELYRQYTSRQFPNNFGIYADLFNACANCPKTEDKGVVQARALRHAKQLYFKMLTKFSGKLPPEVYHNIIKAFGRCGEIECAFDLLDKMGEKRIRVSAFTVSHVLHACISDKEAGLRHAILLWRKMRRFKITPNVYCYNLLLRAVKECGVGDSKFLQDILIEAMSPEDVRKLKTQFKEIQLNGKSSADSQFSVKHSKQSFYKGIKKDDKTTMDKNKICDDIKSDTITGNGDEDFLLPVTLHSSQDFIKFPNFLAHKPNFNSGQSIVGLSDSAFHIAQNKFALFGNVSSFLKLMVDVDETRPDIKTISQLLHCINPHEEVELIRCIKEYNVKPDVDFFNQLMRRRIARYDYEMARGTLEEINEFDLAPDIATFGCLAMTCNNNNLSTQLLKDLKDNGIKPNIEILTSLLRNACHRCAFQHIEMLLNTMSKLNLKPNLQTTETVEKFYHKCQNLLILLEKDRVGEIEKLTKDHRRIKILQDDLSAGSVKWRRYVNQYKLWLRKTEIDYPDHPWKQFLTSRDLDLTKTGSIGKQNYINKIVNPSL